MTRRVTLRRLLVVAACLVAIGLMACRGATEILVDIHTDVPCTMAGQWQGVAVYAGTPGLDVETAEPILTTTTCDASGNVGSIALLPQGSKDAAVGVRVVAGLTRAPDDCATSGYAGCIVARRTLSFIPHTAIHLDILLSGACAGQACDALHTCVDGACSDAQLTSPAAPDADVGPTVRCGDNAAICGTTGDVCCVTVADGGATGACMDAHSCPPGGSVLLCDDDSDCAGTTSEDGGPTVCCLSGYTGYCNFSGHVASGAQCVPQDKCYGTALLCEDRQPCLGQYVCQPGAPIPGYHWCCI